MIDIQEYKNYLMDYLVRYHNIVNPNKFFTCLNPNHLDNNPSMIFTNKYNICKCFACGISYDIFDLIGMDFNLESFKDKINKIKELYLGYVPTYNNLKKEVKKEDYTNYYNQCKNNIYKTQYLQGRGISDKLIDKYNIGYDEDKNLVIFPINKNCYFARSIIGDIKRKSSGISDIWNKKNLLDKDNEIVYVTEGIIDALSLEEIDPNIKTVSINGVGNINSLIKCIKDTNFNNTLVIVFDNDIAGINATNQLKEELTKLNVNFFCTTLISNYDSQICKDINKALTLDRAKLKSNYDYFSNAYKNYMNKNKEGVELYQN